MYKFFYGLLTIFWVLDIFNLPFMQMFDTTYPINGWVWLVIWAVLPTVNTVVTYHKGE